MGLIDKIKKNLFNEEEDKLVQDERNLRSLNPNYNKNNVTFTEPTPTSNNINSFVQPEKNYASTFQEEVKVSRNNNIIKNFYPTDYKDTEDIAKAILDGYTVEVDLSSMSNEHIIRTLDFLSGLTYGRGKVNRRSKYEFTFIINE